MNSNPAPVVLSYSNPRRSAVIENWPLGGNKRGPATFTVESHPKRGERGVRVTTGKPKALTYAEKTRIVDGSDGRTYFIELTIYGSISVMRADMQLQQESIPASDPRHAATLALFTQSVNMDNIYNPDICPSSLNEQGEPVTEGVTAHIWDDTTNPVTCAECGAEK